MTLPVGDVITRAGVAETAYLRMMGELKEFLQLKSVPQDLNKRVVAFHERLFSHRTVFDEGQIMSRLPVSIRSDLVLHMFGTVLRRVPLFNSLDDSILADVCCELKAGQLTPSPTASTQYSFVESDQVSNLPRNLIVRSNQTSHGDPTLVILRATFSLRFLNVRP